MDFQEKIRSIPASPGVYLYKNDAGQVIYVGKAKGLRHRVSSYFHEGRVSDAKTGTLLREAVDVDYIVVANNKEALALENHLIKQKQPRFNILLRDDKTYPYIKLTLGERFPRVFVTRRLKKDGSIYYGPYFPGNLAHRLVDLIHRNFMIPSCKLDLTRYHPRPCLQYYIKRCLGPCVKDLTTLEIYAEAVRDVQLFLEGRGADLSRSLRTRMDKAAREERYEQAAKYRDLISTVEDLQERQRIAAVEGDDTDVFGFHFENDMLAVNLFHLRGGKILDRREMFWEELPEFEAVEDGVAGFNPGAFFSALLKQVYIDQQYVPKTILSPVDFEDRRTLEELLTQKRGTKVEILVPVRGEKRSLIDLAAKNAHQSYDQRFRVMKPSIKAIQESLQDALTLSELPKRIECFDISHIQGAETVASLVVWEDGKMNKAEYRKFKVMTVLGVDDFASMREVVHRRYKRVKEEGQPMPSLVLIDGGLGQLHAAADALEDLGLGTVPLASIAKKEEVIYLYGNEEEPVVLDRRSPVLHLVQMIRDESHRFAVGYHRQRRAMRDRSSELLSIPGVGALTRQRLLTHFGSLRDVQQATAESLSAVVPRKTAESIWRHFHE